MKKKLVSILLCLCMVLTLLPTAALATETTHNHPVCGASCSHSESDSHTAVDWTGVDALPTEAGNYYLTADVTLSATWEPVNGTVLCLNGHTITGANNAPVITVTGAGVTFTLTDCQSTGEITHATNETGCGVNLENENSTDETKQKPVFNMYGGSITGNTATYGGGVYMNAATIFNLYGGTITDNTATSYGGGLYAYNSDFTMYGGAITGNTAAYGGGLYMTGATCIMSGGTIGGTGEGAGNTAKNGGGLYMNGSEFTMSGGSITGNTANDNTNGGKGGGVYVTNNSTFTMSKAEGSEAPSITGNTAAIPNGSDIPIDSCGGGVYLANATFNLNAGTISGNKVTNSGGAGTTKGGGVYMTGGHLACYFTMTGGTIGGTGDEANSAKYGGGVAVYGGSFTMNGGSITGNKTHQSGEGGGVYLDNNNDIIFDMKGGTISSNTAKNNGGGVYLCSGSFTMSKDENSNEAPSITGNNVTNGSGGGVYMTGGTFTVSGPVSVTTNTVGSGTDAPKSNVYLNTNKVITITGALNSGDDNASIGVTLASDYGDAAFTSGWSNEDYNMSDKTPTDYFTSDDSNLNVKKDTDGELKLQGHEHTWTYALQSGTTNVITATCNSTVGTCGLTDGKGGTYTITAPASENLTYNGSAKEATVTRAPVEGVTNLPEASTFNITYQIQQSNDSWAACDAPKDVGTYTASITLDNGEAPVTASVTYTITKATPMAEDFTFKAPTNPTYDGNAKSATVTSDKTGMGTAKVYYEGTNETTYEKTITPPTNVGSYKVTFDVTEGDNYTAATDLTADSWTFTIGKAAQTITVPTEQKTIQANSSADISRWASVAGVTGGSDPGALTYALDGTIPNGVTLENNTLSVSYSVAADTEITIKVTAAATGNYNEATGTFTVKVSPLPAASVATAPAANTLTYNGEEQALVVAGSATGGTMVYRLGSDGDYSESIPEAKDAATYTVYYKVVGDDTHLDSGANSIPVTIAPKTLAETDLEYTGTSITKEYDGNTNCTLTAVSVKSGVLCGDDTLTINGTAVYNSADVATASSVTFTPNVIATGNYRLAAAETLTISASITAKSITPTVDDIGNVDFTGNPLTPDVTVKNGDTPLTLNTDYTVSYTDNTDAGTATVNVSAKQDGNYTFTTVTKNFTITTAGAQTLSDITVNQKYSVTTEQTVSIGRGGMPDNAGALTYAKKSDSAITGISSWSVNETTGAVSYTLSGSGTVGNTITLPVKISSTNYADSTVNVKITLTAKDGQNVLTLTASADTVVYNGTLTLSTTGGSGEGTVSYSVTNGTGAASISGSTLTATKVGTVTVKATKAADDNYAAAESNTITITITQATPTGAPKYTAITTSGKKLSDAGLTTTDSTFSVEGSVKWVNDAGVELDSTTEVTANTVYKWLFTPTDTTNYNTLSGSITLYPVSAPSYSGGGSSGGSSSASGTVTVPVSSDSGTVNVRAEVSKNGTATVEISDRQIEQVAKNGSGTVTIDVSGAKNVESVQVPAQVVETTNKAENTGLTVALPDGSVALDSTALESASQGKDITISVQQVPATDLTAQQQKAVGDMANIGLVVDVDLFVGGTKQSSFNGGTLTISIPYTPKRGEDTSKLTVWFIRDDGTIENKGGHYDAAKGCFIFETDHLSRYVLVNVSARFADVPVDAYFAGAVNWAVQNGVTGGVTETAFAPYASCTRAQIVTFLYRYAVSAGLDVSVGEDTNILSYNDAFDVPEYAIPAFQWACGAGITQGNNGNLMPNQTCTRAQAVAFLYRFAALTGMDVSVGEDTNILSYNDVFTVPEYAVPAFQWAVGAGVMQGSDGNLMPNQTCTRAQIVTMLYRLLGE